MPQPLARKIETLAYGDVFEQRPQHANAILQIISEAAEADLLVGKLLVTLSPYNGHRLAQHYNGLENEAKKGATVEAIASVLLTEERQKLLRRILAVHKSAMKMRTPFAHFRIAYTREDDDLIVVIDPKSELLAEAADVYIRHHWINNEGQPADPDHRERMLARQKEAQRDVRSGMRGYRLAELEEIAHRLRLSTVNFKLFQWIVTWKGAQEAITSTLASLEQNLRNLE